MTSFFIDMQKAGLLLDFIGFLMLFWQSVARPARDIKNGGGSATTPADEEFLMEKVLKWIPSKPIRTFFAKHWQAIAFGIILIGLFLQLISCS